MRGGAEQDDHARRQAHPQAAPTDRSIDILIERLGDKAGLDWITAGTFIKTDKNVREEDSE